MGIMLVPNVGTNGTSPSSTEEDERQNPWRALSALGGFFELHKTRVVYTPFMDAASLIVHLGVTIMSKCYTMTKWSVTQSHTYLTADQRNLQFTFE
jgi:hypothetical protein